MRSCSKARRESARRRCGERGSSRRAREATECSPAAPAEPRRNSRSLRFAICSTPSSMMLLKTYRYPRNARSPLPFCVKKRLTGRLHGGRSPQRWSACCTGSRATVLCSSPSTTSNGSMHRPNGFSSSPDDVSVRRPSPFSSRGASNERTGAPLGLDRDFEERLTVVHVGPLSLGALHRMLSERLGAEFPRPLLRRIHEASGGNPYFALEIGRLTSELHEVDPSGPLPVPQDLAELLGIRLALLSANVREVAVAAATLHNPSVPLLERALGRDLEGGDRRVGSGTGTRARRGIGSASRIHCSRRLHMGRRAPTN